jgi:hypothetical protein
MGYASDSADCLVQAGYRFSDLLDVSGDFDLVKYLRNAAFLVDYYCRSLNAQVFHTIQGLLFPDVVSVGELVAFIYEQPVRQLVFLLEFLMGLHAVGTDSHHHCIHFPEPGKSVAKIARFTRSARGVVFRVEKENNVASVQRAQSYRASVIRLKRKVRSDIAFVDH